MKIDNKTIDDVLASSSITQVIGHYIPLVKKGKGYTAVCPFHDDHHPSLSISESKQIYKCFVCGAGGNAYNFVMNYKKISFPESVKEVAAISGIDIKIDVTPVKQVNTKFKPYYDVLEKTCNYANYLLTSTDVGKDALAYLENRGIDKEVIKDFNIGYNPSNDMMYQYLNGEKVSDEFLSETNVCRLTNSGMKDVFSDRIMFPIHDSYGNPVAFTARDFKGLSDSKYINTSETKIYTKGNIIYNYHRAKDECRKQNCVIVVEGVLDVIAFVRAGFHNVVATLGTACSENQLKLIQMLNKNIIFAYDGDEPGRNANVKNGLAALKNGNNVFVLNNDTGLDPDEILAKYGKNKLRDLFSTRYSYVQYAFEFYKNSLNLNNFQDKKDFHNKMCGLISLVKDPDEKKNYENQLYDLTKIEIKKTNDGPTTVQFVDEKDIKANGLLKAQYNILIMMSMSSEACDIYKEKLGYLIDDACSNLALAIILDYKRNGECKLNRLLNTVEDDSTRNLITTIATTNDLVSEYNRYVFENTIDRILKETLKKQIDQLKNEIDSLGPQDREKERQLMLKFSELVKEYNKK